jgi:hypothetical protein
MKYMVVWSIHEDNFKETLERWATQNPQPPEGVSMLGRWHEMGTGDGFALFETDDPAGLASYIMGWADLVDQQIVPVIEDDDVKRALGG